MGNWLRNLLSRSACDRRRLAQISLVLVCVLAGSSCSGKGRESATQVRTIEVKANAFHPNQVTVSTTTPVITFTNLDTVTHNVTMPRNEFPRDMDLLPNSPAHALPIKFEGDGEYEFFCKYHRAQGMTGKIVVRGS